jgi:hypothetical protein
VRGTKQNERKNRAKKKERKKKEKVFVNKEI